MLSEKAKTEIFKTLLDEYKGYVFKIAFSFIRDKQRVEDIVQDVFLDLYRSLDRLKDYDKLAGWLKVVTRNTCIDWLKKKRGKVISLDEHTGVRDQADFTNYADGHQVLYWQESSRNIMEVINTMPENQRQALILRHTEHLSYKEIAEILNTSVSGLKSVLFRARNTLRRELDKIEKMGEEAS